MAAQNATQDNVKQVKEKHFLARLNAGDLRGPRVHSREKLLTGCENSELSGKFQVYTVASQYQAKIKYPCEAMT